MKRKLVVIAIAGVALIAAAPTDASAATLPASASYNISTTKMDDGRVFWFQRNSETKTFRYRFRGRTYSFRDRVPGSGEIFMRQFGSNKVERIFKPAKGTRITAFEFGDGKLLIGTRRTKDDLTTTKVAQLIEADGKWVELPLVERSTAPAGGHCGEGVELIDIRPGGQPLLEFSLTEGLNGACGLVRRSYDLKLGADPATAGVLASRKTGWSTDTSDLDLAKVAGDGKDWYLLINDFDMYSDYRGVININDGQRIAFQDEFDEISNVEFTPAGSMLVRIDEYKRYGRSDPRFSLRPDPARPNDGTPLRRKGSTAWFHSCGENLLEISRRKATKRRAGGSMWNLYMRDASGAVVHRFKQRLPRSTYFNGCNANLAVFGVPGRTGRVKQVVVGLTEAGPTGSTGASGSTGVTG